MSLSKEEALQEAHYELRFKIGNMPHLSDPEYNEETGAYEFDIMYTHPEIPDLDAGEEKVTYYESQKIGEMTVHSDGSIERTENENLEDAIVAVRERVKSGEIDALKLDDADKES